MRIVWSPQAQADLRDIYSFYAVRNPTVAVKMLARIHKSADALLKFPRLGKLNEIGSCRLLQVPDTVYLLPYRAFPDAIEVLAVFDQRQERPDYLQ